MTSPTIKNHTIECGKRFKLDAFDEHGNPVEHWIYPTPISTTPPATSGPTGPTPVEQIPPVGAMMIAGERPEDDLFSLTIPFSELPELRRDDVEHVVAYRVRVTSPVAEGLHIDVPSNALPNIDRGAIVVLSVPPDVAGGTR